MIITLANNKEGTGKSTIAVNIATLRAMVGRAVLLIDLDPKKSAFEWSRARECANIQPHIPVRSIMGKHLETEIGEIVSDYNDIVIDASWRNTRSAQAALEIADMVMVPVAIDDDSVEDLKLVVRRIKVARRTNPGLWALVVITHAEGVLPIFELDKIRHYIGKISSTALAGTVIRKRESLQQAFSEGLSIFEYKPADPLAMAEMHDLYRALKRRHARVPSLSQLQKYADGS